MSDNKRSKKFIIAIISCLVCVTAGGLVFLLSTANGDPGTSSDQSSTSSTEASSSATTAKGDTETAATDHVVYVETGHGLETSGNWDAGCSWSYDGSTYEEAKLMIPIAKAMTSYLERSGVTVYSDADEDNNKNLEETLDFLDEHREVDAFVNIHCDWEQAESGTMPLYRTEEQLVLAKALNKGVHEYIDIPDRGPTYRNDLDTTGSEKVHCPAVLFETGSIKADNSILTQLADEYGKGLAKGLCDYLGVEFKD